MSGRRIALPRMKQFDLLPIEREKRSLTCCIALAYLKVAESQTSLQVQALLVSKPYRGAEEAYFVDKSAESVEPSKTI